MFSTQLYIKVYGYLMRSTFTCIAVTEMLQIQAI